MSREVTHVVVFAQGHGQRNFVRHDKPFRCCSLS
jgi:hypothetical protein